MSSREEVLRLGADLVRTAAALGTHLAASTGLHSSDVRALQALDAAAGPGGVPMSALAELLGLTRPATTALVARLEERDLARRERDPGDRRVVRVVLGPAARRFGEQHLRPLAGRLAAAAGALDADEARVVATFLARVLTGDGTAGGIPGGGAGDVVGRRSPGGDTAGAGGEIGSTSPGARGTLDP